MLCNNIEVNKELGVIQKSNEEKENRLRHFMMVQTMVQPFGLVLDLALNILKLSPFLLAYSCASLAKSY